MLAQKSRPNRQIPAKKKKRTEPLLAVTPGDSGLQHLEWAGPNDVQGIENNEAYPNSDHDSLAGLSAESAPSLGENLSMPPPRPNGCPPSWRVGGASSFHTKIFSSTSLFKSTTNASASASMMSSVSTHFRQIPSAKQKGATNCHRSQILGRSGLDKSPSQEFCRTQSLPTHSLAQTETTDCRPTRNPPRGRA